MTNNEKQVIVNALIKEGKRLNLKSFAVCLSWVQFEVPNVKSADDTLHYEIRWSKFKNDASDHDGKTLYIELHAEKHNYAKKYKNIAKTKGLGRLESFLYDSGKYIGFRIKGKKYDLTKILDSANNGCLLIQNVIQDVLSLDRECRRNRFF